jgi:hypothetical protein
MISVEITKKEVGIMLPNGSIYSVGCLIGKMERDGEGCDYGNWGICTNGEKLFVGSAYKKISLCVPLIDIIDYVERNFPEYGRDEVFVSLNLRADGSVEWHAGFPD